MNIAYLNGVYLPREEAYIPALDRGFLFGDSIYEVIPVVDGRMVGFKLHVERLMQNLTEIEINLQLPEQQWRLVCETLIQKNGGSRHVYLQVSRGVDAERLLSQSIDLQPTVLGFCLGVSEQTKSQVRASTGYKVATAPDIRWQRCNIKSTSMLASALTIKRAAADGCDEVVMYNADKQITEGCSTNVFIVKNGELTTPILDHQILPGITRHILLGIIKDQTDLTVQQCAISLHQLKTADEVIISSSTKGIAAVVQIDGTPVGDGKPGKIRNELSALYLTHMFEY